MTKYWFLLSPLRAVRRIRCRSLLGILLVRTCIFRLGRQEGGMTLPASFSQDRRMETGAMINAEDIVFGLISPPMKVKLDQVFLQSKSNMYSKWEDECIGHWISRCGFSRLILTQVPYHQPCRNMHSRWNKARVSLKVSFSFSNLCILCITLTGSIRYGIARHGRRQLTESHQSCSSAYSPPTGRQSFDEGREIGKAWLE